MSQYPPACRTCFHWHDTGDIQYDYCSRFPKAIIQKATHVCGEHQDWAEWEEILKEVRFWNCERCNTFPSERCGNPDSKFYKSYPEGKVGCAHFYRRVTMGSEAYRKAKGLPVDVLNQIIKEMPR